MALNRQEQQTMREAIARRLGYTQESEAWWIHPDGTRTSNDGLPTLAQFVPLMLAEVARRDDGPDYVGTLEAICGAKIKGGFFDPVEYDAIFELLVATPEQHARAFLEVVLS